MKASHSQKIDQQAVSSPADDKANLAISTSKELGEKITQSLINSAGSDLTLW
jgi:hypothetical protein